MEEYLQHMKILRTHMNEVEDQAAKVSVEKQMQLSTVQNLEKDLLSVRNETVRVKEDADCSMKSKGLICTLILEKQQKKASSVLDSYNLSQTLDLIQQERTSMSVKLNEKREYFSNVLGDIATELKDQQDGSNTHKHSFNNTVIDLMEDKSCHKTCEDEVSQLNVTNSTLFKLDDAKAKYNQMSQMKQNLVSEKYKIQHSMELVKGKIQNFASVYMACVMQEQRIGISFYDSSLRHLHVLELEDGNEFFPLVQMVKYQARPSIIYACTDSEKHFLAALQRTDGTSHPPTVKLVKSSLFCREQAWQRLMYLHVTGMDDGPNTERRISFLKTVMDIQSDVQVRSSGGLLAVLEVERIIDTTEQRGCGIASIAIDPVIDKHPSHMGIDKAEEGSSVIGMMNKSVESFALEDSGEEEEEDTTFVNSNNELKGQDKSEWKHSRWKPAPIKIKQDNHSIFDENIMTGRELKDQKLGTEDDSEEEEEENTKKLPRSVIFQLMNQGKLSDESTKLPNGFLELDFDLFNNMYLIKTQLGIGGFGIVYLCEHRVDGLVYAIKVIPFSRAEIGQTLRECHILARVNHPNVVRYYNSWVQVGFPSNLGIGGSGHTHALFLAMEYCPSTLGNHLKNPMDYSPEEKKRIFHGLVKGLVYLESKYIVHRDISPGNIFLDLEGNPKIGDFGLAIYFDRCVNGFVGKEWYNPKVQEEYTPATDMFSFAMSMYDMLYACRRIDRREQLNLARSGVVPKLEHSDYISSSLYQFVSCILKAPSPSERLKATKLQECLQ